MRVLVTGGAGFVGSHLSKLYRQNSHEVVVLDNLKRRGSELNLPEFKSLGIEFKHGDIRNFSDFQGLGNFDLMIEASAEPSVLAGVNSIPDYLLQTNIAGAVNCFQFAQKHIGTIAFLSTSRVYSIKPLAELPLKTEKTRFVISNTGPGFSENGINENFPVNLARSLYGASKLSAEYLLQEFVDTYKVKAIINRCGVIAGEGQFGKVDQGVFTLWMANHYFKKTLQYTGFGGKGLQVRDLLHPRDLYSLLNKQLDKIEKCNGDVFNVGGGNKVSTSLAEWTALAQEFTGNSISIKEVMETASVDIPLYVSDYSKAKNTFNWEPKIQAAEIAKGICDWLKDNETQLRPIFQ